jgi:hypothetical protein
MKTQKNKRFFVSQKSMISVKIFLMLTLSIYIFGCSENKVNDCSSHPYYDCPAECVVCPPCEVCSSVSCQTEEFCKGLGFDRQWYENNVFKPNESNSQES